MLTTIAVLVLSVPIVIAGAVVSIESGRYDMGAMVVGCLMVTGGTVAATLAIISLALGGG